MRRKSSSTAAGGLTLYCSIFAAASRAQAVHRSRSSSGHRACPQELPKAQRELLQERDRRLLLGTPARENLTQVLEDVCRGVGLQHPLDKLSAQARERLRVDLLPCQEVPPQALRRGCLAEDLRQDLGLFDRGAFGEHVGPQPGGHGGEDGRAPGREKEKIHTFGRLLEQLEEGVSRGVEHPVGVLEDRDLAGFRGRVGPRGKQPHLADADRLGPSDLGKLRACLDDSRREIGKRPLCRQLSLRVQVEKQSFHLGRLRLGGLHARLVGVADSGVEPARELSHRADEQVAGRGLSRTQQRVGARRDFHVGIAGAQQDGVRVCQLLV